MDKGILLIGQGLGKSAQAQKIALEIYQHTMIVDAKDALRYTNQLGPHWDKIDCLIIENVKSK